MIGIIGAMQEEVSALLNKAEITKKNKLLDTVFYEGVIEGKEVVILQGGIGKVNSAICVSLLLTNYDIDYVINIGSAGGLKQEQNVGDVVVSNAVAYHDVDSMYKMEKILANYDEENDDEDFYFHWHVDHLEKGSVKHSVEIIDKVNQERVYEEHLQKTFDIEIYRDLLEKVGFKEIEVYSDFNEYNEECERNIFVCKKG